MTTASIFGIVLAPLYAAIAQVESDNGKTSNNVYQIRPAYLKDVNRIIAETYKVDGMPVHPAYFYPNEVYVRSASELMMKVYWEHYGYLYYKRTATLPTAEVLARIHNGGPNGWRKESTLKYWHKVKAAMDAAERSVQCLNP